jgi:ATP-dependent Clp protease, protease subunit
MSDTSPEPMDPQVGPLLKTRNIMIFGEITQKVAQDVCEKLFLLSAHSDEDIRIFINSEGGDVEASNCIHDMINLIQPDVKTIGTGVVTGAGALIFCAPPRELRYSLPNTRFTLYQPESSIRSPHTDISGEALEMAKMRQRLAEIFSRQTGQSIEKVLVDLENTFWLTADEAKNYGLVGNIIASIQDI